MSVVGQQVAVVLGAAGQDVVVVALLPIDVVDAGLDLGQLLDQALAFLGEKDLALGDALLPLQAKLQVAAHLFNAHAALLEADEAAYPLEVAPAEVYTDDDLNWTNDQSRVTREYEDESLRDTPLAQTTPDNWADYDTVLLGYPIWWAIAAWPCDHFATDNGFTGKKVIPFCTSVSSGLGQSGKLLADAAGTGGWQDGKRFSSGASDSEVRTWAARI